MKSPFENDPFALIAKAFENLYPGKTYTAYWDGEIRDTESGDEAFGLTDFGDDGSVAVFVKPSLKVSDAIEIFAHELAHVAVGADHGHDAAWEDTFDEIFTEYNRIGEELYGNGQV